MTTPSLPHVAAPAAAVSNSTTIRVLTGVSAVLLVLSFAAALVDPRTLGGEGVWLKPAKFALSFVVLFGTMALVIPRLSHGPREGLVMRITLAAMAIAFWGEMAYIAAMAARGEASHFNVTTAWARNAYTFMGIGALVLIAGVAVVGWMAGRDRDARMGPATRAAVCVGFILSTALTFVCAGYLGGNQGHFVGTPSAGAPTIPLLGWSGEVGDLRPAHFLALHAMQVLPLLGLWLDRTGRVATVAVPAVGLGYTILTAAVFAQALMGLPLIRL